MKFAVLSVLSASYATASVPVPLGCAKQGLLKSVSHYMASCTMSAPFAQKACCDDDNWGYALGGDWGGSPRKTHHNELRCLKSKPTGEYEVYEACDQPCPGRSMFSNAEGLCGGGCRNCANFPSYESVCKSDTSIPCGALWSVYDCKQQEPKINSSEIVVRDESVADAAIDDDSNIGAADTDSS
eukprot:Lankesteria_metandrocarpae@DN5343_c0_g2_i3.p1